MTVKYFYKASSISFPSERPGEVFSLVGVGCCNIISGSFGGVFSGYQNQVTGNCSFISGGANNTVNGAYSSILGGSGNVVGAAYQYAGVFGCNVNAVLSCAMHANNFVAQDIPLYPGFGPLPVPAGSKAMYYMIVGGQCQVFIA